MTDLVEAIGDDKIYMQPLAPAITNMQRKKDYNVGSFATQEEFDLNGMKRLGIVLWVEREDFEAAKKKRGVE
jgi:hypothetical protein